MLEAPPPLPQLDPVLLASRWLCGDLHPENVAGMAIELIEAGHEEPSVYRVAAEDKVYNRGQIELLLQRMFLALKVPYPMPQETARHIVARQIAREVTAGMKNPWLASAQLDRVVPHWETTDKNIWEIYGIVEEADWDPVHGPNSATLEQALIEVFGRLARSQATIPG